MSSTTVLECGCYFSRSMFGECEPMGFRICDEHAKHPDVQKAIVSELKQIIKALLDQ